MVRHSPRTFVEAHPTCANTPYEQVIQNIQRNIQRNLPTLMGEPPNGGHVVIVGGGPSVADDFGALWIQKLMGRPIYAINGAAKYLHDRGITPDALILVDARPHMTRFLEGIPTSVELLLASMVDPAVFDHADKLNFKDVTIWHTGMDPQEWPEIKSGYSIRSPGNTAGLLAIPLVCMRGYRHVHLFGFDSCYSWRDGEPVGHPYPQPENDNEQLQEISIGGRTYEGPLWMLFQAARFPEVVQFVADQFDADIHVHGHGLIRAYADELDRKSRKALDGRTDRQDHDEQAA